MAENKVNDFGSLLESAISLRKIGRSSPTLFEIIGLPHYESVYSKLLAFFLDPLAPHGLGTVVLESLLDETVILSGDIKVECEVQTHTAKRLDIVISSDNHIIAIENKIYHQANNPFFDYSDYLHKVAGSRKLTKIILSLHPVTEGKEFGFNNILYSDFINRLRSRVGAVITTGNMRYVIYLFDMLETIENLQRGISMDNDKLGFFREHRAQLEELLSEVNEFKKWLRAKVEELRDIVDVSKLNNVRQWFYRETNALFDILVHDINISDGTVIAVDTMLSPSGWKVGVFSRGNKIEHVKRMLDRLEIKYDFDAESGRCVVQKYELNEPLERISEYLHDLIHKLSNL